VFLLELWKNFNRNVSSLITWEAEEEYCLHYRILWCTYQEWSQDIVVGIVVISNESFTLVVRVNIRFLHFVFSVMVDFMVLLWFPLVRKKVSLWVHHAVCVCACLHVCMCMCMISTFEPLGMNLCHWRPFPNINNENTNTWIF
jgi:hypothetical protein